MPHNIIRYFPAINWAPALCCALLWAGGALLPAQKVTVETLQMQKLPQQLPLQGQLQPIRIISHYPVASGEVQKIYVRSGQRVRTGDKLFSVLPIDLRGKIFRISVVYARSSGIVSRLAIKPQQMVGTSEAALQVVDQSTLLLRNYISDVDFPLLDSDTPFYIHLDGKRDNLSAENLIAGRLWQRDYIPNKQGLFPIDISFAPNSKLYGGKFVIASGQLSFTEGFYIPVGAIVRRHGKESVWLVDGENKISLKQVQLDVRRNEFWRVHEGLEEGQRYISELNGVIVKEGQQLGAGEFTDESATGTDSSPAARD